MIVAAKQNGFKDEPVNYLNPAINELWSLLYIKLNNLKSLPMELNILAKVVYSALYKC